MSNPDTSLRPRPGETAEDVLARVIAAVQKIQELEEMLDEDEDE